MIIYKNLILNNHTALTCFVAVVAMATENMPHPDFSHPPPIEFSQPPPEFSRPPPEFSHAPLPDFSQPPPVLSRQPLPPCDFPQVAVMQASDWDGVSPREQCTVSLPTLQTRDHMLLPPSSNSQQHIPMVATPKHMATLSQSPGGASDVFHDVNDQLVGTHARVSAMGPRDIPLDHPHPIGAGDPQECPRDPRERDHWDSDSADDQRCDSQKYGGRSRSVSQDRDYRRACHESHDCKDGAGLAGLQSPQSSRKRPVSPSSNARSMSKSPDRPATPISQSSHSQTKSQERLGDVEPGTVQLQSANYSYRNNILIAITVPSIFYKKMSVEFFLFNRIINACRKIKIKMYNQCNDIEKVFI